MAAGKQVIAADALAPPHLVQPGVTGWLDPPGDVAALADRLRLLLADLPMQTRMGIAGCAAITRHAMPATIDTFTRLYEDLSGRTRGKLVSAADRA